MPIDRSGTPLVVGQRVIVRCIVKSITNEYPGTIVVTTDELDFPNSTHTDLTLNSRTVEHD